MSENAVSAYISGRYAPFTSEMSAQERAELEMSLIRADVNLARMDNKIRIEIAGNQRAGLQAMGSAYRASVDAIMQAQRSGQVSHGHSIQLLNTLEPFIKNMARHQALDAPPKLQKLILEKRLRLRTQLHAGAQQRKALLSDLRSMTPDQARAKIGKHITAQTTGHFVAPLRQDLFSEMSTADPATRYAIKKALISAANAEGMLAYGQIVLAMQNSNEPALQALGANLGKDGRTMKNGQPLKTGIVSISVANGVFGSDPNLKYTKEEKEEAQMARAGANKFFREQMAAVKAMASGGGMSPELQAKYMSLVNLSEEMVKNPLDWLSKVQDYPALSTTREARENLKSLRSRVLDQEDPIISKTIQFYATWKAQAPDAPPEDWMAAMGFEDPIKAHKYASEHMPEVIRYVSLMRDNPKLRVQVGENPEQLARVLRQEGIYREGRFRTGYLMTPLERFFGFGLHIGDDFQMFPGNTSEEQLTAAGNLSKMEYDEYATAQESGTLSPLQEPWVKWINQTKDPGERAARLKKLGVSAERAEGVLFPEEEETILGGVAPAAEARATLPGPTDFEPPAPAPAPAPAPSGRIGGGPSNPFDAKRKQEARELARKFKKAEADRDKAWSVYEGQSLYGVPYKDVTAAQLNSGTWKQVLDYWEVLRNAGTARFEYQTLNDKINNRGNTSQVTTEAKGAADEARQEYRKMNYWFEQTGQAYDEVLDLESIQEDTDGDGIPDYKDPEPEVAASPAPVEAADTGGAEEGDTGAWEADEEDTAPPAAPAPAPAPQKSRLSVPKFKQGSGESKAAYRTRMIQESQAFQSTVDSLDDNTYSTGYHELNLSTPEGYKSDLPSIQKKAQEMVDDANALPQAMLKKKEPSIPSGLAARARSTIV